MPRKKPKPSNALAWLSWPSWYRQSEEVSVPTAILVAANRELITRMEAKIQATLARVWGEEAAPAATEVDD